MRTGIIIAIIILACTCFAEEGRILRYPDYSNGNIVFSYMGDLWTVKDDASELRRITVHGESDLVPRFSPDGGTIAFSGFRHGNFDVYTVPADGGTAKRLTIHSRADVVVGWTPTGNKILFASWREAGFRSKLYTVSADGGMPEDLGTGSARRGSFSPDGGKMVFNRRGFRTWRKKYRGSSNTDLWIVDLETKDFKRLTDFDGQDAWPMWATEDDIYFASDRDNAMNIWKISPEGDRSVQVTKHPYPGIKYPSLSRDKKTIVYEFNSGLWMLTIPQGVPHEVKLDLPISHKSNEDIWMTFTNRMDSFSTDSSGNNVAFSIRGEIFNVPVNKGNLIRLTKGEARDKRTAFSPDGKKVAYISDEEGEEKIYIVDAKGGKAESFEPAGNVHYNFQWSWGGILLWSPDNTKLAYGADSKLCVYDLEKKTTIAEIEGIRGLVHNPGWSPDSRWLAYSRRTEELQFDIFAVNIEETLEYRLTNDAQDDYGPTFTPDGKGLLFISNRTGKYQVYHLPFDKWEYDLSDPDEVRLEAERKKEEEEAKKAEEEPHGKTIEDIVITDLAEDDKPEIEIKAEGPKKKSSAAKVTIDMDNIKQRIRRITSVKGDLRIGPIVGKDSMRAIFSSHEVRGNASLDIVYSAAIVPTGNPASDFKELASADRIREMDLALDGDKLFLLEGSSLFWLPAKGGAKKPVSYSTKIRVDQKAERAQIFNEVWRALRDGFYDEKMHGQDWKAIRESYRALLDYVVNKDDLAYLINEMLGELNASHMGYSYPPSTPDASTSYLGIKIKPDATGRYRIDYIFPEGPADKDYIDLKEGDYILEIDGVPIKPGDNYYELLTNPLNRKVDLLVSSSGDEEEARTVRLSHIPGDQQQALFYADWVENNRKYVEENSLGRIGYLHIKSMNGQALEKFRRDLTANADKEALIIDVRWNGGGNVEQEVLDILERKRYQKWIPRDIGEEHRPHEGFFGPKAVLINSASASNAEMFPAGFRELGLGKIIGVQTAGAVIGTISYSLIDGRTVRMPMIGVSLLDGTNMENYGVKPDIYVDITPSDELAGRNPQLDAAINHLVKELGAAKQ